MAYGFNSDCSYLNVVLVLIFPFWLESLAYISVPFDCSLFDWCVWILYMILFRIPFWIFNITHRSSSSSNVVHHYVYGEWMVLCVCVWLSQYECSLFHFVASSIHRRSDRILASYKIHHNGPFSGHNVIVQMFTTKMDRIPAADPMRFRGRMNIFFSFSFVASYYLFNG